MTKLAIFSSKPYHLIVNAHYNGKAHPGNQTATLLDSLQASSYANCAQANKAQPNLAPFTQIDIISVKPKYRNTPYTLSNQLAYINATLVDNKTTLPENYVFVPEGNITLTYRNQTVYGATGALFKASVYTAKFLAQPKLASAEWFNVITEPSGKVFMRQSPIYGETNLSVYTYNKWVPKLAPTSSWFPTRKEALDHWRSILKSQIEQHRASLENATLTLQLFDKNYRYMINPNIPAPLAID